MQKILGRYIRLEALDAAGMKSNVTAAFGNVKPMSKIYGVCFQQLPNAAVPHSKQITAWVNVFVCYPL